MLLLSHLTFLKDENPDVTLRFVGSIVVFEVTDGEPQITDLIEVAPC